MLFLESNSNTTNKTWLNLKWIFEFKILNWTKIYSCNVQICLNSITFIIHFGKVWAHFSKNINHWHERTIRMLEAMLMHIAIGRVGLTEHQPCSIRKNNSIKNVLTYTWIQTLSHLNFKFLNLSRLDYIQNQPRQNGVKLTKIFPFEIINIMIDANGREGWLKRWLCTTLYDWSVRYPTIACGVTLRNCEFVSLRENDTRRLFNAQQQVTIKPIWNYF